VTVAKGREDHAGRFTALLPSTGSTTFYRAVAKPRRGATPIATDTRNAGNALGRVWGDDFNGTSLNRSNWALYPVAGTGRNCAESSLSQVRVAQGAATLSVARKATKTALGTVWAHKAGCPHGYYLNVALRSTHMYQHGVFAARIKFESGGGQHGAFVLQAGGPHATEMDTVEYFGDGRKDFGIGRGVYPAATRKGKHVGGLYPQARGLMGGRTPSNSWHVYAVKWTPSGYLFTIDGKPTLQTRKPYVSTTPEYMVIGLVTSDYELPHLARNKRGQVVSSKSRMQVDWVRTWQ
jgi:beta-glucanase (GH16 family)